MRVAFDPALKVLITLLIQTETWELLLSKGCEQCSALHFASPTLS